MESYSQVIHSLSTGYPQKNAELSTGYPQAAIPLIFGKTEKNGIFYQICKSKENQWFWRGKNSVLFRFIPFCSVWGQGEGKGTERNYYL